MAYLDDNYFDTFSEHSTSSSCEELEESESLINEEKNTNIVSQILNRQIYGKFAKNSKAKTEKINTNIFPQCRIALGSLINTNEHLHHVFMGFTLCSKYFISFTEKGINTEADMFYSPPSYEYELHLWQFHPGTKLKYLNKFRIFKQLQGSSNLLDNIMVMQCPADPHKIICYGIESSNTPMAHMSIFTLPTKECRHCDKYVQSKTKDLSSKGWCSKHGFILHYTFSLTNPFPTFNPNISLAYPDHLVINTGHYVHILNITTSNPPQNNISLNIKDDYKIGLSYNIDTQSEASETVSDHCESNSVVDAIIEDFNEYDLEGNECNKPFHELNISCEPLNVTGKSYHNTLVQNIVDPRIKRIQSTRNYQFSVPQCSTLQKMTEKSKNAEEAYEFIEENEKCEKLSLFRKKRLAEKKYEFSEDNTENIVPFNSLRKERRFLRRCIRSPDLNTFFLSPRSPGIRSPIQSPNSRNGQFSPSSSRNVYCTSFRNSPHHFYRSPISPKDTTRKFHPYSSFDSDTDCDLKLIMRGSGSNLGLGNEFSRSNSCGLLIVDPAGREVKPKWLRKVVRRYSNGDFENGSLVSGQSRDDYNIPFEIPLLAQTLSDQQLDIVPEYRADHLTQMQLIATQKTFDCEQFVQRQAQEICSELQMQFLHCNDYDIQILHICPLEGHIICKAIIKFQTLKNASRPTIYCSEFVFAWNISTDAFKLLMSPVEKVCLLKDFKPMPPLELPKINCKEVMVHDYSFASTKTVLRDYENNYEIHLGDIGNILRNSYMSSDDFLYILEDGSNA